MSCLKWLTCVFAVCLCGVVTAAPPTLSFLHPAGARRGTTSSIQVEGSFSDWPPRVWANAGTVTPSDEKGELSVTIPETYGADRIWIRVFNAEGASSLTPLLVGQLHEIAEVEPNDSPQTAQTLENLPSSDIMAVTVNGVLQKSGDVDAYRIKLSARQTLVVDVAANARFGSPIDAIVQVASPDGYVLEENHDYHGLDPRLAFTADEAGDYIVRVFAFPSTPNRTIRFHGAKNCVYRLTLTTGPFVSHVVPASIQPDTEEIQQVLGWNLPSPLRLPIHDIRDDIVVVERAPPGFLSVSDGVPAFVHDDSVAGSVRVRRVPYPSRPAPSASSGAEDLPLEPPVSVTGILSKPRSEERFRLPLTKGKSVVIAVESQGLPSQLVPWVRLADPSGKVVQEKGTSGSADDVLITHQASVTGIHQLTIRDRYRSGGRQHLFRLTVLEPQPDFGLTLTADAFVLTSKEPLEIPVAIERSRVASSQLGKITIKAVNLPDGVTCTPVISEQDGATSKKVTVVLQTDGTPYSGHVAIRGTADGGLIRNARTPTRYDACFERFWLTVRE